MTGLSLTLFVLSAALLALVFIKANWVRSVRRRTYPSGGELPTSAFVVARTVLLTMAAVGIWQGAQGLTLANDAEWSDDELSSAVHQTADDLDGYWYRESSLTHDTPYFDDYGSLIEDTVIRYGGGGAPQSGVGASAVSGDPDADGDFTVQADGTDRSFCLHVETARWKKQDYTPPGLTGGEGSDAYKELAYRLTVRARGGAC
ncbi:hypothetical protein OKJ48_09340 [Streptomyces kunmingensis]|uniref:Uncharacterized protein n=1 Tax=Streptomyces kunmingensis TaxID=68225 RepID=A0ABU6C782_9ACTN|nr:hypothetical protein [Streptomyces kunmingensis]MEB3960448.1 hypothetical protein [Streptomyces kunmingensis]